MNSHIDKDSKLVPLLVSGNGFADNRRRLTMVPAEVIEAGEWVMYTTWGAYTFALDYIRIAPDRVGIPTHMYSARHVIRIVDTPPTDNITEIIGDVDTYESLINAINSYKKKVENPLESNRTTNMKETNINTDDIHSTMMADNGIRKIVDAQSDANNASGIWGNVLAACRQLKRDVGSTMGPNGYNVAITHQPGMAIRVTKDGATVAELSHNDDIDTNAVIKSITEVAKSVETEVGDGTTSATIMSTTLLIALHKCIVDTGTHPRSIIKDMDAILDRLITISNYTKRTVMEDDWKRIAMVSTNHDEAMAEMVVNVVKDIGPNGRFQSTTGIGGRDICNSVSGYTIDSGICSELLLNGGTATTINASVVSTATPLSMDDIDLIIDGTGGVDMDLVVLCPSVTEHEEIDIIKRLMELSRSNGPRLYPILLSGVPLVRTQQMGDIKAISLDGSTVVMERTRTTFQFNSSDESVEAYISSLEEDMEAIESGFDLEMHKDRIQRLRGGYATIMASGTTAAEAKERKDRINDAILAVQSSIREGYVIGGGNHYLTLLNIILQDDDIPDHLKPALHKYLSTIFVTIHVNSGLSRDCLTTLLETSDRAGERGEVVEMINFDGAISTYPVEDYPVIDSAGTPVRIFNATRSLMHTLLPVAAHVPLNKSRITLD